MSMDRNSRDRNITAVLGPTNTGKTHLALERMLAHKSGLIGLPLRLLAREVYDRIVARIGAGQVALVTGEEKIKPRDARYWVSTVEAMPRDLDVEFLAIDEVQLAGDPERGHVFTDRMLHARGSMETLLLGAQSMAGAIGDLVPGANFITRPRLSQLTYSGQKKITRLPRRTAVIAFSAQDVYSIAELMRRQRGGAAVVLGGLSPRTRNAQVALYQSGDVDFIVATDAIGMGLNLDVDHVAFSATRKFDGERHRDLTPGELAQIAGRAGRHMNDGTFGVTGDVQPFEPDLVERLETHRFDSLKKLQWRNTRLDFSSLDALQESLAALPDDPRLMRARPGDDLLALEAASRNEEIRRLAAGTEAGAETGAVEKLWQVAQVPDYRKISNQNHAEMIATIYKHLMAPGGLLPEDWFAAQVRQSDRADGDIDTLSNRIAHIRTWTFVSNRSDWLKDPGHWQGRTREIEDKLSDALHKQLVQRFVDKRTSALMRGMRDKDELFAEIADDGAVHVEKHFVGRLQGFLFTPQDHGAGIDGKAARSAAAQVLGPELAMRARRVAAARPEAFTLNRQGMVLWRDQAIARLEAGDDPLKPQAILLSDEHLNAPDKEKVQARVDRWLAETIAERLKPLVELSQAEDVSGLARGIAFQLKEGFGCLRREAVANEIRALDQPSRAQLRKYGVRFGAFNIFFPLLLKPAAADLLLVLWTLKEGESHGISFDKMPEPPRPGLTSLPADLKLPADYYRVSGFHLCGPRAVRCDILERLADLIRPLLAWKPQGGKAGTAKAGTGKAKADAAKADVVKSGDGKADTAKPDTAKADTAKADVAKTGDAKAMDGDEGKATAVADGAVADGAVAGKAVDAPAGGGKAKDDAGGNVPTADAKTESAGKARSAGKPQNAAKPPPAGATGDGGFTVIPDMMSILGCSGEELGQVLQALGFRVERRAIKPDAGQPGEAVKTPPAGAKIGVQSAGLAAEAEAAVTVKAETDTSSDGLAVEASSTDIARAEQNKAEPDAARQHAASQGGATDNTKQDAAGAGAVTSTNEVSATPDKSAAREAQFIEIWRPSRRRYAARKGHNTARAAAHRGPAGRQGAKGGITSAGDVAGKAAGEQAHNGGNRKDGRRDGRRKGGRHKDGLGNAGGGRRGGSGKRHERQGTYGKPQVHRAGPAKKRKAADPDSPFAALASLKKQLEKKSEEQSSS